MKKTASTEYMIFCTGNHRHYSPIKELATKPFLP